jgi:hypothetical protein
MRHLSAKYVEKVCTRLRFGPCIWNKYSHNNTSPKRKRVNQIQHILHVECAPLGPLSEQMRNFRSCALYLVLYCLIQTASPWE